MEMLTTIQSKTKTGYKVSLVKTMNMVEVRLTDGAWGIYIDGKLAIDVRFKNCGQAVSKAESLLRKQMQNKVSETIQMNKRMALEILGLPANAKLDDIKRAHKQLALRLHPDQGGSTYLATQINLARDFLLKK